MLSEYAQVWCMSHLISVLILVVVEYALWDNNIGVTSSWSLRLNPCCSGICSLRSSAKLVTRLGRSLNPCCSGICSLSTNSVNQGIKKSCLNPCCSGICSLRYYYEYQQQYRCSLNPCCSGICSLRSTRTQAKFLRVVLILVVVEYALWVLCIPAMLNGWNGLNPCCSGICSLSYLVWAYPRST